MIALGEIWVIVDTSLYEPGARTRSWVKVKYKVRIGWPGEGTEYTRG